MAEELIGLAEKVSVTKSSTLVARIKVTARTIWSRNKIEEKKARLEAIRGQLLYDIVVPMAGKINTIPGTSALDTQTETLLNAINAGEDTSKVMEERLRAFNQGYAAIQQGQHNEVSHFSMTYATNTRDMLRPQKDVLNRKPGGLY